MKDIVRLTFSHSEFTAAGAATLSAATTAQGVQFPADVVSVRNNLLVQWGLQPISWNHFRIVDVRKTMLLLLIDPYALRISNDASYSKP